MRSAAENRPPGRREGLQERDSQAAENEGDSK